MTTSTAKSRAVPSASLPSAGAVFLTTLAVAATIGVGALVLWSTRITGPLVLGVLALLAMIGVFFLFGAAAGHIRMGAWDERSAWLGALADGLEPAVKITGSDGSLIYANSTLRALLGEGVGGEPRTLEEVFSTDPQAAESLFRIMRAAERGETHREEFRFRSIDGRGRATRWLRLSVRPLPAVDPRAQSRAAVLWQIDDITHDRAREAETIRALEASLGYYDRLPAGVLALGGNGAIAQVNHTMASLLGLDPSAVIDRSLRLSDVFAAGGDDVLRSALQRSGGQRVVQNLQLRRESGESLPVDVLALPSEPDARGITATILVMPSRSEAEADPAASEVRFARFFHSAPFGLATVGADGRILSANAAFGHLFQEDASVRISTMDDVLGCIVDEQARADVQSALSTAQSGRSVREPIEVRVGTEGRYTRRVYVSPVAAGRRQSESAVLYVLDATEQKALELKYAQSTKMEAVGKLAGGIAHDFNNVLTAIIGFSDLLLQTHRPTDAAYRDIMNIKQNANRAAGLVRQLLAFSRRQTLLPEVLELGDVISDLSIMLNRLIGEKVALKIVTGRDLWLVKADRTQLEQVIINLAVNARDAMPDGGELTIQSRNLAERDVHELKNIGIVPGEYVEIAVTDTGHGMTPEIMAKIFEPFFSTKEVGKGTGLGLSTVYGIVKQTGGYVYPESTPGKGTTFRVYLPRHVKTAQEEAAAAPKGEKKKEPPRDLTGSGRVLLVEDEDSVRNFAIRALKRQGYEVLEATTGAEALELFEREQGRVDIVVSDVVMPEMDGPTMLKELRKRNPATKVIFVSGYPDDAFKKSLDPNEQFAFLPKPFTLPQLAAKVKEELER